MCAYGDANFHVNGGSVKTQFRNVNGARLLEFATFYFLLFLFISYKMVTERNLSPSLKAIDPE